MISSDLFSMLCAKSNDHYWGCAVIRRRVYLNGGRLCQCVPSCCTYLHTPPCRDVKLSYLQVWWTKKEGKFGLSVIGAPPWPGSCRALPLNPFSTASKPQISLPFLQKLPDINPKRESLPLTASWPRTIRLYWLTSPPALKDKGLQGSHVYTSSPLLMCLLPNLLLVIYMAHKFLNWSDCLCADVITQEAEHTMASIVVRRHAIDVIHTTFWSETTYSNSAFLEKRNP